MHNAHAQAYIPTFDRWGWKLPLHIWTNKNMHAYISWYTSESRQICDNPKTTLHFLTTCHHRNISRNLPVTIKACTGLMYPNHWPPYSLITFKMQVEDQRDFVTCVMAGTHRGGVWSRYFSLCVDTSLASVLKSKKQWCCLANALASSPGQTLQERGSPTVLN